VLEAERTCVATAARALAAGSLVPGTSGNISVLAGELVAISASGAALERLEPAHVVVVDRDGRLREGEGAPSSELALHLAIYRQFPSARAVVHAHPACGTALASVLDELPVVHYAQVQLGGAIRVARYATFGTDELAAATVDALAGRTAALMANHGAVTHGGDLASAVAAMELLEWLCALHLRAAALGTPRTLDREEQRAVQEAFTLQEAAKR
jgi:L-fuculose-phosphate aldolase